MEAGCLQSSLRTGDIYFVFSYAIFNGDQNILQVAKTIICPLYAIASFGKLVQTFGFPLQQVAQRKTSSNPTVDEA